MKCSKTFIVTVVVLLLVGEQLWHDWNEQAHALVMGISREQEELSAYYTGTSSRKPKRKLPVPTPPLNTNQISHDLSFRQSAAAMSEAEMAQVASLFDHDLKPAVEKWARVYSNRVPFDLADLNMSKFVESIGHESGSYHSYIFVMGDITLGIAQRGEETWVQYLASKRAVNTLQALPPTGASPDISMPVTPNQVLTLARSDSGIPFPPNEVRLIPSAMSGSLAGGAIADVGSAIKNAANIPISKSSAGFNYVFQKDGILAYYFRN
jgi:hypothetical protein